jgi:hypothetical protein
VIIDTGGNRTLRHLRHLESGRVRGKVVLTVARD